MVDVATTTAYPISAELIQLQKALHYPAIHPCQARVTWIGRRFENPLFLPDTVHAGRGSACWEYIMKRDVYLFTGRLHRLTGLLPICFRPQK